jgi:hypothetical protein
MTGATRPVRNVLPMVVEVPATVAGKVCTLLRSKMPSTSGNGWGEPI